MGQACMTEMLGLVYIDEAPFQNVLNIVFKWSMH